MRRADRLFQIIQILRSSRQPVTAMALAVELETSQRSVYRDIADLLAQQVPIRGEAGVGYVLDKSYNMPPLMLTPAEIEAAVLGAQWVSARGDASLRQGARDLIAKISAVIPEKLRPIIVEGTLIAPNVNQHKDESIDIAEVRQWIRAQSKIRLNYQDGKNEATLRTIWPIAIAYFETVRIIVAWCELRKDFRHFRTDRISRADFLHERFDVSVSILKKQWNDQEQKKQTKF